MLRQHQWIGHVIRMPPHDIFNSPSSPVWGTTARSKVCRGTKEVLLHSHQKNIKKYHMPPNQLEVLAADRDTWCSTCKHGLVIFHSNHTADADRQHLHPHPVLPATSVTESLCVRLWASQPSPKHCSMDSLYYSVFVVIDGLLQWQGRHCADRRRK